MSGAPSPSLSSPLERIVALDGLRGIAACIVVVFHYFYLLHPSLIPPFAAPDLAFLLDTPLGLLWNGRFAVSIFFVLSGFVIAGAADRRREWLVVTVVARYLRLAIPVLGSVILAWVLLTLLPTATLELVEFVEEPSPWAAHTYQSEIPSLGVAIADGLVFNFIEGGSQFNNVLWTMQIELIGSVGIFLLYAVATQKLRVLFLIILGLAIYRIWWLPEPYLAFVFGALLYEAHVRGWLRALPPALPLVCLLAGLFLGAPGRGAAERLGVDGMPILQGIGRSQSPVASVAAALILLSIISLQSLQRPLCRPIFRWFGRISFALYLVHVPLLYTLVAFAVVHLSIHPLLLAILYATLTFVLAHVFTVAVDERSLAVIARLRALRRRPAQEV